MKVRMLLIAIACLSFFGVTSCETAIQTTNRMPKPKAILNLNNEVRAKECVILLHGLARTSSSMNKMASALKEEGYEVINYGYPSRKFKIGKLASEHIPNALSKCKNETRINFVTHSLGGIMLRKYLQTHKITNLNRVVMLGPPNGGSEVVDNLKNVFGYQLINGPAGMQLGTGENSIPNTLGVANYSVGIIAGSKSINPLLSLMLPNPNDGKVSAERTKLKGMADHIVLPVSHPFLMKNKLVISQVITFLKKGTFEHNKPSVRF